MPRKKKEETVTAAKKTPSKPKSAPKAKAAPKTVRATASKTPKTRTSKPAASKSVKNPKATSAAAPAAAASSSWKKPSRQGETQMVAFVRDPHCIFTYWEVTPESVESVKKQLMGEYKDSTMVLRVFRTGLDGQAELIQEIRVEPTEMNRYVELKEGTTGGYFIEIAQKTASGRTVVYARSNKVVTGTFQVSQGGAPAGASAQWETPAGLLEYFSELEGTEEPSATRGLSSAEAHRRALLRKQMGRYSASRMG